MLKMTPQTDSILMRARARQRLRGMPALARAARLQAGLTQAEVATALGVCRASIARWEAGNRVPRGGKAADYLDLLDRAGDVAHVS